MPASRRLTTLSPRLVAFLAALVALAAAGVLAGCGDAVPSDAVAKVGDTVVSKADFNHWYQAAARQQSQQTGLPGATAAPPDPPSFSKCIAARQRQPVPKGVPKPSTADLKAQCQQEYTGLRDQTMQFLISAQWLTKEASARGVKVTPAEVTLNFNQQKQQAFPNNAQYQRYLQTSGQTQQDLLFRVRLSLLTNRLQQKIVASAAPVSNRDVTAYYNQNKQRFAQPETRDLLIVLTTKKQQADAAVSAIKSGQPWAKVAKKYSVDTASKANGGRLPAVSRGQQEKTFDNAIFSAPKGALEGPVKTQFGYYVFRVTNVTRARQQNLTQASTTIRSLLKSQREQTALNNFVRNFQKKYKSETQCAKDFLVQQCANAPKPKTPAVTPGAPPQGAPPQGAPPQGAPPQGAPPQGAPPQGAPPQTPPSQQPPPQGAPPQGGP